MHTSLNLKVTRHQSKAYSFHAMDLFWSQLLMTRLSRFGLFLRRNSRWALRATLIGSEKLSFHMMLKWWPRVVMTGQWGCGTLKEMAHLFTISLIIQAWWVMSNSILMGHVLHHADQIGKSRYLMWGRIDFFNTMMLTLIWLTQLLSILKALTWCQLQTIAQWRSGISEKVTFCTRCKGTTDGQHQAVSACKGTTSAQEVKTLQYFYGKQTWLLYLKNLYLEWQLKLKRNNFRHRKKLLLIASSHLAKRILQSKKKTTPESSTPSNLTRHPKFAKIKAQSKS